MGGTEKTLVFAVIAGVLALYAMQYLGMVDTA
jgi:hypothetical protein